MPKKRAQSAEEIPLRLSAPERKSLLQCTSLKRPLKQKIEESGDGTQVLRFTRKELDALHDEILMGVLYAVDPHRTRLLTLQETLADFLDSTDGAPSLVGGSATRRQSSGNPADLVFRFKITLLGTKPAIWRRILVRDATLDKLHEHIQSAMGWTNSHLHEFVIGGCRYGDPEYLDAGFDDAECVDSTRTLLSAILPTDGKPFGFKYVYDFGDNWEHAVICEGSRKPESGTKYPVCTAGARACPPDDVGGVWGFYDYLEALGNPKHDRHKELLGWGGPFDAEAFDAAETTRVMRRRLPKW